MIKLGIFNSDNNLKTADNEQYKLKKNTTLQKHKLLSY